MPDFVSAADVRDRLKAKAAELGSQNALAAAAGISPAYLSDILLGRREPTDRICALLSLKRETIYVPLREARASRRKGK